MPNPRIVPEAALAPGVRDARTLLLLWFIRKSSYWVFGLGLTIAMIADPTSVRLCASVGGLIAAYPLARAYEEGLEPRTNFGRSIGIWLDRYKVARAFRSLRWTHHVRQHAIQGLGPSGARWARLDPIMDVANIVLLVVGLLAVGVNGGSGG